MTSTPLISVMIPVYNGERHIAEALDSVLSQNHRRLEVIVVDDGSTDRTASVVQRYPQVRYCYQANRGSPATRNRGLADATGELFAFLDADDLWSPGKLAGQIAALAADADLDAVLGHTQQFFSPELPKELRARMHCPVEPQPGWHTNALLIRRDAFYRIGLFDNRLPIGEVIEWFTRADAVGLRMLMLPEVVFRRRLHASNSGQSNHHQRHFYARIAKAALDRRRARGTTVGSA